MPAGEGGAAKWAGIDLPVRDLSGSAPRRKAVYTAAYRDGATTEDLGRDPRKETYTVSIPRADLVSLERAINAGKPRVFTHPHFGSFSATLNILNYRFTPKLMAEVQIEVLEEKAQKISVVDTRSAKKLEVALALWEDASAAVDELVTTAEFDEAWESLETSWGDLYAETSWAEQGASLWQDVDRALVKFQSDNTAVMDLLREDTEQEDAWPAADGLLMASDTLVAAVAGLRSQSVARRSLRVDTTTDIYTLLGSIYGQYAYAEDVFDENGLLDPFMVEAGTVIQVPVS